MAIVKDAGTARLRQKSKKSPTRGTAQAYQRSRQRSPSGEPSKRMKKAYSPYSGKKPRSKTLRDTDRGKPNLFYIRPDLLGTVDKSNRPRVKQSERKIAERKKATGVKKKIRKQPRSPGLLWKGGTYKQRLRQEEKNMGTRWV